jgi:hypothetical protein
MGVTMIKTRKENLNILIKSIIFIFIIVGSLSLPKPIWCSSLTLTATPLAPHTDTQVKLNWSSISGVKYYKVFRNGTLIKTIDLSTEKEYLSFDDTGLIPETYYVYRLTGYSDDAMLNTVDTAGTTVQTSKLLAPSNINGTYDINSNTITLNWTNASTAVTSSIIKREDGIALSTLNTSDISCTFSDPNINTYITNKQTVKYYIIQQDSAGHTSTSSAPTYITPIKPPSIGAVLQNTKPIISIQPSQNIEEFTLERSQYLLNKWGDWSTVYSQIAPFSTVLTDTLNSPGIYRYRLAAKVNGKYTGYSNLSQTVTMPGAPKTLIAAMTALDKVALSWTIDPDNTLPLHLERRTAYSSYTSIADLDSSATSYTDAGSILQNNIYYYRISVANPNNFIVYSNECSISTYNPSVPSGLYLTAASDSQIDLAWNGNGINELGFKIERKTDLGNFTEIATVSADTALYSDLTVSPGHMYTYRVLSYNYSGNSVGYSNEVSYSTSLTLNPPSNLTATPASSSQIDLMWTYPGTSAYNTIIERKTGSQGTWLSIGTVTAGTTTFSDVGLSGNTAYSYRVKAILSPNVYSLPFPNDQSGRTANTLLNSPNGLQAVLSASSKISLSWLDNSDETEFIIERKTNSEDYVPVATTAANTTFWVDTSISSNNQYTYRVKASNLSNESNYSNEASAVITSLVAPSSLAVSVISDSDAALTWVDTSSSESGFEIWKKEGNAGTWQKLTTVGTNITSYTDKGLSQNTTYYYKVRSYINTSNIYSDFSNEASTIIAVIAPPDNLQIEILSSTQINLSWTDNSDNETTFIIERKTGETETWSPIAILNADTSQYVSMGLSPDTQYYYRVRASDDINNVSALSEEVGVITEAPVPPSNLAAQAVSSNQISLSWAYTGSDLDGFIIERQSSSNAFSEIVRVSRDITEYVDKSLSPQSQYSYRIKGYNQNEETAYSNQVSVLTKSLIDFEDIGNISWAKDAIKDLAGRGVIKGKSIGKFAPGDSITRAEFISIIIRAYNLSRTATGSFADVTPNDWFYNDVLTAKMLGIASGKGNNYFYPNQPITREEMAVIIARTQTIVNKPLPSFDSSILDKYTDSGHISSYAVSSIASLNGEKIMNGKSDLLIAPKDYATRAEVAVMIYKVLNR